MNRYLAILLSVLVAATGCQEPGGKDNAKMVGTWQAEVNGMVQHLANGESLNVEAIAIFKSDGKVEIKLDDGESKGFQARGAFELDGSKLKLNVIPFGGQSPQTVTLGEDGESFTMESIAGQLTFTRA